MQNIYADRANYALNKINTMIINAKQVIEDKTKLNDEVWKKEKAKQESLLKDFPIIARKLPAMIQANGLIQTIVFCISKKKAHGILASQILDYLIQRKLLNTDTNHVEWIVKQDAIKLMQLTSESIEIAYWIKRITDGTTTFN